MSMELPGEVMEDGRRQRRSIRMAGGLLLLSLSVLSGGCSRRTASIDGGGALDLAEGWEARLEPHHPEASPRAPVFDESGWRPADEVDPRSCEAVVDCDVWVRRRLVEPQADEMGWLVFRAYTGKVALYLDDELLYRQDVDGPSRLGLHVVPLPEGAAGAVVLAWLPDPPPDSIGGVALVRPERLGDFLPAFVAAPLGQELWILLLAVVLVVVGVASTAIGVGRRQMLAASFGAFSLAYGLRLLVGSHLALLLGVPVLTGALTESGLTYLINLPAALFLTRLVDTDRRWERTLVFLVAAFAAVGMGSDFLTGEPFSLARANNVLVLLIFPLWIGGWVLARRRLPRELAVAGLGGLVFVGFAALENLGSLGLVSGVQGLEPLGFVVFLACLGWVVVRRLLERERRLVEISSELATARRIQSAILPQSDPEVPGLRVASRYRPASEVAGDYYDFFPGKEAELGVVVADVAGHGVPAALIASMVKMAFASQADHVSDPARVLDGVNRALCGRMRREFVTAAYLWIDAGAGFLLASRAGHPHPLLWGRGDREPREIGGEGALLGRFPQLEFDCQRVELKAGDRLLLFTDGLLEARSFSGELFGEERLHRVLLEDPEQEVQALADRLLERLASWTGESGGEDDLTLVIVEIGRDEPGPDPLRVDLALDEDASTAGGFDLRDPALSRGIPPPSRR